MTSRLVERNLARLASPNTSFSLPGQFSTSSFWSTVVGSVHRSFGSSRTSQDSSPTDGRPSSSKVTDITSVAQWDEIMNESKLGNKGVIAQFTAQWYAIVVAVTVVAFISCFH